MSSNDTHDTAPPTCSELERACSSDPDRPHLQKLHRIMLPGRRKWSTMASDGHVLVIAWADLGATSEWTLGLPGDAMPREKGRIVNGGLLRNWASAAAYWQKDEEINEGFLFGVCVDRAILHRGLAALHDDELVVTVGKSELDAVQILGEHAMAVVMPRAVARFPERRG